MLDYVPSPNDRRRWRGLHVGVVFLVLCLLCVVVDVLAITCLGTNAGSTFSTGGPAPRSVPTRR